MKIEKGKTYTYEEIKEIYKNAKIESISNPTKKTGEEELDKEIEDANFQISLMLSGMILFDTLEKNLFEQYEEGGN